MKDVYFFAYDDYSSFNWKKQYFSVKIIFFSVILIGLIFLPKDSISTTEIETSYEESYDPFEYKPESPDRFEIMTQISLFISNVKVNAGLGCYFDSMC